MLNITRVGALALSTGNTLGYLHFKISFPSHLFCFIWDVMWFEDAIYACCLVIGMHIDNILGDML